MEIGDEIFVKEVIAHVRGSKRGSEEELTKIREMVSQITEYSDLTLQKLVVETNKDPETSKIRQTIMDQKWNLLPPELKNQQKNLSTEMGLIFVEEKIYIPRSLRERILQVIHGDHESVPKMRLLAERVFWPNKEKDIKNKAKQCITCFRSGKNLNSVIPENEVNHLPKFREVGEEVQIDFIGPVLNEKNQKKQIIVAIDQFSKWTFAKVCDACNTKTH